MNSPESRAGRAFAGVVIGKPRGETVFRHAWLKANIGAAFQARSPEGAKRIPGISIPGLRRFAANPGYMIPLHDSSQKNAMVRTSMLSRGGASGGLVGSSNALCGMKRARPSSSES
jgi:hypothetical protein